MGNTRKGHSTGKLYPFDKNKYSKAEKYAVGHWSEESEYEETNSMKMRMKPQSFKSIRRNTFHEDNKDE